MTKKFFVNQDFQKNQILNARFQQSATDLTSPLEGQYYYNTVEKKIKIYDGTAWVHASADIPAYLSKMYNDGYA